jgi:hypothetical protein
MQGAFEPVLFVVCGLGIVGATREIRRLPTMRNG